MAGGYGLQFQPGVNQNGNGPNNGSQARGRVQEPVQVLSTRLPKVFGAQALAPGALLSGAGGMGASGSATNPVAQALAQLAGLPPGMLSMFGGMGGGGGIGGGGLSPMGGGGMFGPPGLQPGGAQPQGGFAPPPPRVVPGDVPMTPPPVITAPMPSPNPGRTDVPQESPSMGGWLDQWRNLNGRPSPSFGSDAISQLAGGLFR